MMTEYHQTYIIVKNLKIHMNYAIAKKKFSLLVFVEMIINFRVFMLHIRAWKGFREYMLNKYI